MSILKKNSATSLFKQKNNPELLASQTKERNALLKLLSRAIKEVQLQFANQDPQSRGSGAIVDCRGSQHVCSAFESVLKHGLKSGGWFGQGTSTFWPVVLKISRKEAIEFIGSLQHAKSDSAKCRGWIRTAVNESSLESYINVICHDSSLLSSHYEPYSFLRDPESVSAITHLLTGLSLITFKLTVDVASLEFDSVPEAYSDAPLRMNPARVTAASRSQHRRKAAGKRAKSKPAKEGREEVEVDNCSTASSSCISLDSIPAEFSTCNGTGEAAAGGEATSGPESPPDGEATGFHPALGKVVGGPQVGEVAGIPPGGAVEHTDWLAKDDSDGLETNFLATLENGDVEEGCVAQGDSSFDTGDEWDVEATLTADHMTDHMTGNEVVGWDALEEVTGQSAEVFTGDCLADQSSHQDRDLQDGEEGVLNQARCPDHSSHQDRDLQNRPQDIERRDTLVAEHRSPSPSAMPPVAATHPVPSSLSLDSPLTSPSNPFAPPQQANLNPFITDINLPSPDPLNPFSTDDTSIEPPPPDSINPFTTGIDPIQPASPTSLNPFSSDWISSLPSTNPFAGDDLTETLTEPRPQPHLVTPTHETLTEPRPHLATPTLQDSPYYDFPTLDPCANSSPLVPETSSPLFGSPPSPPNSRPPPSSAPPLSPVPSPSPNPSRSHTTDDLESCSSSSIDVSMFLETTPPSFSPPFLSTPQEDHYAPEMSTVAVQVAIDRLKVDLTRPGLAEELRSTEKEQMRHKIVALQMRLRQLKDEEEELDGVSDGLVKEVYGHQLLCQPRHVAVGKRRVCEACGKRVRGLIQAWYLCKTCGFGYHRKCLATLERVCSGSRTPLADQETPNFILEVCPEKGLTEQLFRCARCNVAFNSPTPIVARLCDYSGLYYCPSCHHNDLAVIPARVVHNWDFAQRKVCCRCCDLLDRHSNKPLLKVHSLNPQLYTYVQDLVSIEALRKDLLVMKSYFTHCSHAKEARLLQRLDPFPHFKEGARRFSLLDLKAVHSGTLLRELTGIHKDFVSHIKKDCPVCSGKGFLCELCNSGEILYPFDRRCRQCPKCRTIYHRNCYAEMTTCPKCSRTRHHKVQT